MTVTNPYYEFTPAFIPGTVVKSDAVNTQFAAIQTAFDFLPGASDAVTTDTAVFAPESGSGNAYVVTMPDTRTSNQDGDGIRFFATHTNTSSVTLNVDGIGAVALVNWDGTALSGSEIVSGRIYEVRYDATGVQFVLAATTDAALQVTYAEEWATEPEDSLISIAAGGDGLVDYSALHWAAKSLASSTSGRVNTDIVTATPPTTEAVTGAFEIYDAIAENDDLLARMGFVASNALQIKNLMHGGNVEIRGEDGTGVGRTFLIGDPDGVTEVRGDTDVRMTLGGGQLAVRGLLGGTTSIYQNGIERLTTVADGVVQIRSDGNTDAEVRRIEFTHQNGAVRASFGYSGSNVFFLQNVISGGNYEIFARDIGSVDRLILKGDPDAITELRGDTVVQLTLGPSGEKGFQATLDGSAIIYHDDLLRLSTQAGGIVELRSDGNTDTETRRFSFTRQDGTARALIGYTGDDVFQFRNQIDGGNVTLLANDAGAVLRTILVGDPDGRTTIRGDTDLSFQVGPSGEVAISALVDSYVRLHFDSTLRLGTASSGIVNIYSDGSTDAEPRYFGFLHQDGTLRGFLGYNGGSVLQLENRIHGGTVVLSAEDSVGAQRTFFTGDPDGTTVVRSDTSLILQTAGGESAVFCATNAAVSLFYNNIERLSTASAGDVQLRSEGNTDAEGRRIMFLHQDATVRAVVGHSSEDILSFENRIHGGNVRLSAEATVGTFRTILLGDPDADTIIRAQTTLNLQQGGGQLGIRLLGAGATELYDAGVLRLSTAAGGVVQLRSDGSTDTETRTLNFLHQGGTSRAEIGHFGGDGFLIWNRIHGGEVRIDVEDSVGSIRVGLRIDPDAVTTLTGDTNLELKNVAGAQLALQAIGGAEVSLYHANTKRLSTAAQGVVEIRSDGNTDTELRRLDFVHQNGLLRGRVGHGTSDAFVLLNDIAGGNTLIHARDIGGTLRTILIGDPDATTTLRGDTGVLIQTDAGADVAIACNLNGSVDLYYNDIQRLSTAAASQISIFSDTNNDAEGSRVELRHQDGTLRGRIGYAGTDLQFYNLIHGGNASIFTEDAVGTLRTILIGDPDAQTILRGDSNVLIQVSAGAQGANFIGGGAAQIYYNNIERLSTAVSGIVEIRSDGNTDTENRALKFSHQDGTLRATIRQLNDDVFQFANTIHGGNILFTAEDAVGSTRTILTGDPDAITTLRGDTDVRIEVAAGDLGIIAIGGGNTQIYWNNIERFRTAAGGVVELRSDDNVDASVRELLFTYQDGTQRGLVGFAGSTELRLQNVINGGHIRIRARDSGITDRDILIGDPDARTTIVGDSDVDIAVLAGTVTRLRVAAAAGVVTLHSNTSTDTETRRLHLAHQDGTVRGRIGHNPSDLFEIANAIPGGNLVLLADDIGDVERTILLGDPDGNTVITGDLDVHMLVKAGTEFAIACNVDSSVDLFYNNIERLSTAAGGRIELRSDGNTDAEARRLNFVHQDGTERGLIGHNSNDELQIQNQILGGNVTLYANDTGAALRTILIGDPDANTFLRADVNLILQCAAGERAIEGIANAEVRLYYNDIKRAATDQFGLDIFSSGNSDTGDRLVMFRHANDTLRGLVGHNTTDALDLDNRIPGGNVEILVTDSGSTPRTILIGDPDAITTLRGDTDVRIEVAAGELAFEGLANAESLMYFNNIQRWVARSGGIVSVKSDGNTDTEGRYIAFQHQNAADRAYVGYQANNSDFYVRNLINSGEVILSANDAVGSARTILTGDPDGDTILRGDVNIEIQNTSGQRVLRGLVSGTTELYYNAIQRVRTQASGVFAIRSDADTDTEGRQIQFQHQASSIRGIVGYVGAAGANLTLENRIHGGHITLISEDTGGTPRTILVGDPDAETTMRGDTAVSLTTTPSGTLAFRADATDTALYNLGTERLTIAAGGKINLRSDGNLDTEVRALGFQHQNGTQRAFVGFNADDVFEMRNQIDGGNALIRATDSGSVLRTILVGDPDGVTTLTGDTDVELKNVAGSNLVLTGAGSSLTTLYHAGVGVARTQTAANGGFQANNTLTGGGFERVATESDIGVTKVKTAFTDRISAPTASADNHLTGFNLDTGGYYIVEGVIQADDSTGTGGIRFDFSASQTPQEWAMMSVIGTEANGHQDSNGSVGIDHVYVLTGTSLQCIQFRGYIHANATTGGTLQLRWAQNSSDATRTRMQEGSWMRVTKIQ